MGEGDGASHLRHSEYPYLVFNLFGHLSDSFSFLLNFRILTGSEEYFISNWISPLESE